MSGNRGWFPLAVVALLLIGCSEPPPPDIPSGPHPIIVLDVDSLRADHLGCYGYGRPTSPNIDALAKQSVRFEWAFAQASDTGPAQASLLSGLYPATHGLLGPGQRLADEVTTLAEALQGVGYTTAAFVDGGFVSEDFGLAQGFTSWDTSHGDGLAAIGPKVVEWLRGHAQESFLLLVHTYDPHPPFAPPEPFRSQLLQGVAPPSAGFEPTPERLEAARVAVANGGPLPLAANDLAYATALYDGEIRAVDEWVGTLVAELKRLGLDKSATVVLVSDHGLELSEHGTVLHDALYSTVTRVPLLLRLPGGAKAQTVSKVVEAVGLMPTLLELAGAPVPPITQGTSMVPLMRGQGTPPYLAFGSNERQRFVALGDLHAVFAREGDSVQLFRFAADPLEAHDLAAAEPERITVLRQHLEEWEKRTASTSFATSAEQAMTEETLDQLKSLGYVQ